MPSRGARVSRSPAAATSKTAQQPRQQSAVEQESTSARHGENLRRLALGMLAALAAARFYWPSEPDPATGCGSGLTWVLMLLATTGLAITSTLIGGRFRFRWSWTDVAVVALAALVFRSAGRGLDQRVAINLSWDWVGLALAYLLARTLPQGREESRVLVGALVATALAVSVYGLYQSKVEMPQLQERFLRNPGQVLQEAKIPDDPQRVLAFKNRLLESNEVYATFALANSLAGFLLGPVVVLIAILLETWVDRSLPRVSWARQGLIAAPLLCLLVCLMLTKSFSALLGLLGALVVLGVRALGRMPTRRLFWTAIAAFVLLSGLLAAGLASGRLDRLLLTQASRSLRYRWEYWQATWGVIGQGATTLPDLVQSATFWSGVGPGNFGGHYLLHKLPEASEEIQDPHNLFLEVWATAGIGALVALLLSLALALWNLLGPARPAAAVPRETLANDHIQGPEHNCGSSRWLWLSAASGLAMVMIVGEMNLFRGDLFARWLVLAAGWAAGAFCLSSAWKWVPLAGPMLGAAVLAVTLNLLAQGGISFTGVALALWLLVALGLNLREDRPCGRRRDVDSRLPGFALALAWAALAGAFAGQIAPFWRSQSALTRADDAVNHLPPEFDRAQAAYQTAIQADPLSVQPLLGEAYLQLMSWTARGARPTDQRWRLVLASLKLATNPPRNPASWLLHSERARITRELLGKVATELTPREVLALQADIVEATRSASRLYPTNCTLHARLADASAEISMFPDAVSEAQEALRLDGLTPHADKKLASSVRDHLTAMLPDWQEKAAKFPVNSAAP